MTPEEGRKRIVAQGRAMVKMVEATDVLLENAGRGPEALLLKIARALYRHRLRKVITLLPPALTTEILAGADFMRDEDTKAQT